MNRFLLSILLAASVLYVQAQNPLRPLPQIMRERMSLNGAEKSLPALTAETSSAALTGADAPVNMIISENFDKLVSGTENAPDMSTDLSFTGPGCISGELTGVEGWGSMSVYAAGGCVYCIPPGGGLPTFIRTPYLDYSTNAGVSTIKFRARVADQSIEKTTITLSHGTIYDYPFEITNEWKEYSVVLGQGNADCYVMFSTHGDGFLLDDIEVSQTVTGVYAPTRNWAGAKEGKSATLTWNGVTDAARYGIDIFHVDDNDNIVYHTENAVTDKTEYTVTDLDPGKEYYWALKSYSKYDGIESDFNEPQRIHYLENSYAQPQNLRASGMTDDGFTASWDKVYHRAGYIVNNYLEHTAQRAEPYYYLLDADFSSVTQGTFDRPVGGGYMAYLDDIMPRSNWAAIMPMYAEGAFGIDNSMLAYDPSYQGMISSPMIDFYPNDEGRVTVSMTVKGSGNLTSATVYYRINVTNADGTVTEGYFSSATIPVTDEWKRQSVTLDMLGRENMTDELRKNTFILIWPNGEGYFWLDDLKVSQSLTKGSKVVVPYSYFETSDESVEMATPDRRTGDDYFFNVCAWGYRDGENDLVGSPLSANVYASSAFSSGISVTISDAMGQQVAVDGDKVTVMNPLGGAVTVFDVTGRKVASDTSGQDRVVLSIPDHGVFILRLGNESIKFIK